jgi:hypothetical protein
MCHVKAEIDKLYVSKNGGGRFEMKRKDFIGRNKIS